MTDDSGGRTEIVRDPRDLDAATAGIADELSKQYYLGYLSAGKKDGRWHCHSSGTPQSKLPSPCSSRLRRFVVSVSSLLPLER